MQKLISTASLTQSEWQEVRLPIWDLNEAEVVRALAFSFAPARYLGISGEHASIKILAASEEEFTALELQLRQALTDQQLRKEINQRSNPRINQIVETVIAKVIGS